MKSEDVRKDQEIADPFMTTTIIIVQQSEGLTMMIGLLTLFRFFLRYCDSQYILFSRRPYAQGDYVDDYEYERRPYRNRNRSESRRNGNDRRRYEDRRFDERRKPYNDEVRSDRRPLENDRRQSENDRRPLAERPRDNGGSKSRDNGGSKSEREAHQNADETVTDEKHLKPQSSSGGVYDRSKATPSRFTRPVPINKFSYTSTEKPIVQEQSKQKQPEAEEYYDEYEDVKASSAKPSLPPSPTTSAKPIFTTTTTHRTTTSPTTTTTTTEAPRLPQILINKGLFQKYKVGTQTTAKTSTTTAADSEYYEDEYYDTVTQAKVTVIASPTTAAPIKEERVSLFSSRNKLYDKNNLDNLAVKSSTATTPIAIDSVTRFNRFKNEKQTTTQTNPPSQLPYSEQNQLSTLFPTRKPQPSISKDSKKFANKQTQFEQSTTTEQSPGFNIRNADGFINKLVDPIDDRDQKPVVRIVKRPFLPSRGGNPYKARGLQPVGGIFAQQLEATAEKHESPAASSNNNNQHRTTLDDIYLEDYDIDLNDALNPNLKPLTSSRSAVSGFSFSSLPFQEKEKTIASKNSIPQKLPSLPTITKPTTSTTSTTSTSKPFTTVEPIHEYEYEEEYEY